MKIGIDEHAASVLMRMLLQRQGNRIAEAALMNRR
jgi:hypothetical protein